jgi:hypothetical protein
MLRSNWLSEQMPKTASKTKVLNDERDREFLLYAPEICIFMACFGMRNELIQLERTWPKPSTLGSSKLFQSLMAQFIQTADATHRFDVVLPVEIRPQPALGTFSPFFWQWFNWWDDYLKGLHPVEIENVRAMAKGRMQCVEIYRPPGDWLRYRRTPAFTIDLI